MRAYELHASAKQVQRSKGRSSVAAAAYRSASILYDERTGLTHDFTKKGGVEFSRIYIPDTAPGWAQDREKLWNGAEQKENRKNSCTARELEVAFPSEFNIMQRREAGDSFARELMNRYNCAVDIAYHKPGRDGDERNYHAHILFTSRGFDQNTKDGWESKKYRDLNNDQITLEGEKTTRGKEEIKSLRDFIAGEMNRIAERDSLAVKTEHLSFDARGIDKEPSQHLGYVASDMERKGKDSERGEVNRDIKASNDNRKQLHTQKNIIHLDYERQKSQLEQEHNYKTQDLNNDEEIAHILASKHKHYSFYKENIAKAKEDLQQAQERLDKVNFLKWLGPRKKEYVNNIQAKQKNLNEAHSRLKELVAKELSEVKATLAKYREQEYPDMRSLSAKLNEEKQCYQEDQKELKNLETALNSCSNIERIVGVVTGKTKAQKIKIEQIRARIETYEILQRQKDIFRQKELTMQQQLEDKKQALLRKNDNLLGRQSPIKDEFLQSSGATDNKTQWNSDYIEEQKQKLLDQMESNQSERDRGFERD